MTIIKLAANFIPATGSFGGNWGHLQLVNSTTQEEIEVQSWNMNLRDAVPSTFPYFDYEEIQLVSAETPGYGKRATYREVTIDIGDRDADEFWDLLVSINTIFRDQAPEYLYGLGQNSNSYIATLLWMVGIDVSGYLDAVAPPKVRGMNHHQAVSFDRDAFWGPLVTTEDLEAEFPGANRIPARPRPYQTHGRHASD